MRRRPILILSSRSHVRGQKQLSRKPPLQQPLLTATVTLSIIRHLNARRVRPVLTLSVHFSTVLSNVISLLESKLIHGSVLLEANRIPNLVSPCLAEKVRRANSTIAIRHSVLEQKGRYLNVLVYNKPLSSYPRMT